MMRTFASVLVLATAGCVAHVHSDSPGHGRTVVVVETAHICSDSCAHFYLDGVWYVETGHRHGPGCGHYLVKGKWGNHKGDDKPGEGHKDKDKDKDKGKGKGKD